MSEVSFVDTTLRDGQLSLWAMGMRTGMMLPVAENLDRAGFEAIEVFGTAHLKKCVRELREDPFERIRLLRERIPNTPLRMIRGRHMGGFQIVPLAIEELYQRRLAAMGVRQIRISDSSNTTSILREMVDSAHRGGIETAVVNLVYSISPKHTDEYYVQKTREVAALGADRICIKDPGGLLTPESTRTLVPAVLRNAGNIPVEFHTHCITGLGPLCCLEAIQLGIRTINTAIPPLAEGSSNPSVFNVAMNARVLGYNPTVDEEALRPVAEHFTRIAKREGLPIGAPLPYDCLHLMHQVPGGMISNFRHQLAKVGMEGRLQEVLEETSRVRQELGYPIMVTPYAQFVGTQAAMNVIAGERYKVISDEVVQYALGRWGEEERSSMDPNIRDRILGNPRAAELAKWRPSEPSLQDLRRTYGGPGVSDDELLLRYFAGADDVAALRAAGPSTHVDGAGNAVTRLVAQLSALSATYIQVRNGSFSITLQKHRAETAGRAR